MITICIGDGVGGADCVLRDGTTEYWPPSKLQNMWMTPQEDMAAFAQWCYKTSAIRVEKQMRSIEMAIKD